MIYKNKFFFNNNYDNDNYNNLIRNLLNKLAVHEYIHKITAIIISFKFKEQRKKKHRINKQKPC